MKNLRRLYKIARNRIFKTITTLKFYYYKVEFKNDFKSYGIPIIKVSNNGKLKIGGQFALNNNYYENIIGRQQPCIFSVSEGAELSIGNNVGMSSTAIICTEKIVIEDNVKIGGNTCIYDTDFHSLEVCERLKQFEDQHKIIKKSVRVCRNTFIGAHTTILKGVTIGENSIIGACSVVTKNIPANEIWAGNPAKFIRKIPS